MLVTIMFASGEEKQIVGETVNLIGDFIVVQTWNKKRRKLESSETFPADQVAWGRSANGTIVVGRGPVIGHVEAVDGDSN